MVKKPNLTCRIVCHTEPSGRSSFINCVETDTNKNDTTFPPIRKHSATVVMERHLLTGRNPLSRPRLMTVGHPVRLEEETLFSSDITASSLTSLHSLVINPKPNPSLSVVPLKDASGPSHRGLDTCEMDPHVISLIYPPCKETRDQQQRI